MRPYRERVTSAHDGVTGAVPGTAGPRPEDGALSPTGLTSFEWDTRLGLIRTDPMGERLRGWPPASAGRPERDFLVKLAPSQVDSLAHRARAAQATGGTLDAQVWTTGVSGYSRLLWMRGRREPAADPQAPLIGAIVDITDLAHSLAVSTSHEAEARPMTEVGRFSWDESAHVTHVTASAAVLLGITGGGAHSGDLFESVLTPESYAGLLAQLRASHHGDVVDLLVQRSRQPREQPLHLVGLVSSGDDGGTALIGTIQDAGDEVAAQQSVVNVSRALTTLSHGNHVLAMATDEQQLLADVCATIVSDGGYHFAWYGRAENDPSRSIVPIAWAGYEAGYLGEMRFSWSADDPTGQGPSGQAIRSGQARFAHLLASHPAMDIWREAALARGYVSSLSLPVHVDGVVDGALMVYATEPTAFDPTEVGLLSDLALGIGTGLSRLADVRALEETTARAEFSSGRLQATLDSLMDPSVLLESVRDKNGVLVDLKHVEANSAALDYSQLTRDEFLGTTLTELYPTISDTGLLADYVSVVETGRPMIVDAARYDDERHGGPRLFDLRAVKCGDGLALTWRDVTMRHSSQQRIADSERRYRLLAENASDVVLQVGSDGRIRWASESITPVLGWAGRDILGRVATDLVHADDRQDAIDRLVEELPGPSTTSRLRLLRADGGVQWMAVTEHQVHSEDGDFRVLALRDIADAVQAQVELEHAMGHDPLTGLATRATTLTRLSHLVERLPGEESTVGVLCIGVDGLTAVNEALTHEAGDHVLAVVASRITAAVGDVEVVGRAGGDEFVVLLPNLAAGADAAVMAERIRMAVHGAVLVAAHRIEPTVSIGIATGDGSSHPESLLRDASLAMRQAKAHGRDVSEFVDVQLAKEARRRLLVDGAIRDALRDGELVPMFQPIVLLADGTLSGYEALVRWIRSDGTTVEPGAFLPVAERTSLITEIDLVILRRSVEALRSLPSQLTIAVNVSAASLARVDYADQAIEILTASGIDPTRLHLEVTETAVLHVTDRVRTTMQRLADAGASWFMDDFGTGYSSISHLRDLPISGLKLDRSFTSGIAEGSEDSTSDRLAQALQGLAVGLGLDTVAEGVETREQADHLAAYGWVHGQGWLYGKAAPLP